MKKIFRNILLGGVAASMLASCNLDLFPTTEIPYEDGDLLILNSIDVAEFQNGVLASYRGLHFGGHYQIPEVMTECFNATVDFGNNYGFVHRLGDGFIATNGDVEGIWGAHYSAIKNYNIAIEQAEMVEDESLLFASGVLKGMALYCRASSYLALARAFSADYDPATAETELCVPLITRYDQFYKPVRNTMKEVYDQIMDDLDEAEAILEDAAEQTGGQFNVNGTAVNLNGQQNALVPTVDAVKALKARCYLDMHEYEDAADMAEEVIKSTAGYALANNLTLMEKEFMLDEGTEAIIRMFASKAEGTVGCSIYTSVNDTSEEGKFFQPLFIPSKAILNAYDSNDLRFQLWFPLDYYPVKIQGTLYTGLRMFTKYIGNPTWQTGKNENAAHNCKPLMLAEMYLIASEAYAQDGDAANAKKYLNALQSARRANLTDGSLESVKMEWLRETIGDGQRINCIKRWGDGLPARPAQDAALNIVQNTPASDYTEREVEAGHYTLVWPIPSYELKIAPGLVQNPGYSAE